MIEQIKCPEIAEASGASKGQKKRFVLNPTLEHLALMKIATLVFKGEAPSVYEREKVCDSSRSLEYEEHIIPTFCNGYQYCAYVKDLPLPKKLKDRIWSLFLPLSSQVLDWELCPEIFSKENFFTHFFQNVSWTSQLTIDKRKTYEAVVKTQALDVQCRYELACMVCLEEDIHVLWNQMLETEREEVVLKSEKASMFMRGDLFGVYGELVCYWSCLMKGEGFRLKYLTENYPSYTPPQYMLKYAAVKGIKAAVEYFCKKLKSEENNEFLLEIAKHVCSLYNYHRRRDDPYNNYGEILCFLLSHIDEKEHRDVIEQNHAVLVYFLKWPWKSFFWDAADLVWADIDGRVFAIILHEVLIKISAPCDAFNYRGLLVELCRRSLPEHKKYTIVCGWYQDTILAKLLKHGGEKSMKLFLKDTTTEDINKLIFDHSDKCVCQCLIDGYVFCDDAWKLYRNIVTEYVSNKNEMEKYKDGLRSHVLSLRQNLSGHQKRILNYLLEGWPEKGKKRTAEDASFSKSKTLKGCLMLG